MIKNNSVIFQHSLLCSGYITGQGITPQGCIQLTYIKSIDMLNKNTPGVKKSEAKSEAPVSYYSYKQLESVISGEDQGPSCLLATM